MTGTLNFRMVARGVEVEVDGEWVPVARLVDRLTAALVREEILKGGLRRIFNNETSIRYLPPMFYRHARVIALETLEAAKRA